MATILLVEDNVEYRKLLAIHMRRARYDVLEAGDGAEVLQLLKNRRADLIVADIMMPNLDGRSMITNLRNSDCEVQEVTFNVKEIGQYQDKTDLMILYSDRDIGSYLGALVYLRDLCMEKSKQLIVIGSREELDEITENMKAASEKTKAVLGQYKEPNRRGPPKLGGLKYYLTHILLVNTDLV